MSNSSLLLKVNFKTFILTIYLFEEKINVLQQFEINIKESFEEGLYILSFVNCFQPQTSPHKFSKSDLNLKKSGLLDMAVSNLFSFDEFKYGINLEVRNY